MIVLKSLAQTIGTFFRLIRVIKYIHVILYFLEIGHEKLCSSTLSLSVVPPPAKVESFYGIGNV